MPTTRPMTASGRTPTRTPGSATPGRVLVASLLIATAAITATAVPAVATAAPEEPGPARATGTLTAADKILGLARFWSEASTGFAYFDQVPGLDWDAAFHDAIPRILATGSTAAYYEELARFCALLQDGHTTVYPPPAIRRATSKPQVFLREVDGRVLVIDVGVDLARRLPRGAELLAIDGCPLEEDLVARRLPLISASTAAVRRLRAIDGILAGPVGTAVTVTIAPPDEPARDVTLERPSRWGAWAWSHRGAEARRRIFVHRPLADGYHLVAINTFADASVADSLAARLPALRDAAGLILDLRHNTGGDSGTAYAVVAMLCDRPFQGTSWRTREQRGAYRAWGAHAATLDPGAWSRMSDGTRQWYERMRDHWTGDAWHVEAAQTYQPAPANLGHLPLAVLVGPHTASAAEDGLVALQSADRGLLVGQTTCGSSGQPLHLDLPGGGRARICVKRDTHPDGRPYVGVGIAPDVVVVPTADDLYGETDTARDRAVAALRDRRAGHRSGSSR